MNSKHTPGPWEVVATNRGIHVTSTSQHGYFADVTRVRGSQDVDADARLIAAAPELLKTAQALFLAYGDASADTPIREMDTKFGELAEAITKATDKES